MASADLAGVTVALLGNTGPGSPFWSTENEWLRAYEHHGATVVPYLEKNLDDWDLLIDSLSSSDRPSFIHWVSTPPWRLALPRELINEMIATARQHDVPTVGAHLDRFWGIRERERWITSGDPYFRQDILFTADGGNQERWEQYGINHRWMLPGVGERWCHRGEVREEYRSPIAFVGSWRRYHPESRHRQELVAFVSRTYGKDAKFWPTPRQDAIRGDELTDLYWSTDVAVGDSFFLGGRRQQPPCCYSSDRITESLGRGAILLHPHIEGVTGPGSPFDVPNLFNWTAWQWMELKRTIDELLEMSQSVRTRKRNAGLKYIREHHTYEVRVTEIVATLREEGML